MFYERYLYLCDKNRLSPSAAAEKAGFNRGTVSVWKQKYEKGVDVKPEQEIIDKICSCYNCTEVWLRGIDEQKEKPTSQEADGHSENKQKLIAFAQSVPEDKVEMLLRVMQSIVEDVR